MIKILRKSIISNDVIMLAIIFTHFVLLSYITILRHHLFLTTAWDLGIFNQAFWTTVFAGKFFYETPDMWFNPGGSFFGVHFSPILLLFIPIYALFPFPETLLVIQSFFVSFSALPLYLIAKRHLRNPYAIVFTILYLLYPPLILLAFFDFHLEALLPLPVLSALYYLDKGDYKKYYVFLFLTLSTIEFTPIITFMLGVYGLIKDRRAVVKFLKREEVSLVVLTKHSIYVMIISIIWLLFAIKVKVLINPYPSPLPSQFSHLFKFPLDLNVLTKKFLRNLDQKIMFLILMCGPMIFLSFLSPLDLILALPWILISFLTDYTPYFSINYQYTAFVFPFLFIASIKGIRELAFRNGRIDERILKRIFALLIISSLLFSSASIFANKVFMKRMTGYITEKHRAYLERIISLIPPNASVLTQNDIFPHISNRVHAYLYLSQTDVIPEFILIDIKLEFYKIPPPSPPPIDYIPRYLNKHPYGIYAEADGIVLYKYEYMGDPVFLVPYTELHNYKTLNILNGHIKYDETSTSKYVLMHEKGESEGVFWFGPYSLIPPGVYSVKFKLKVSNSVNGTVIRLDIAANVGSSILAEKEVNGSEIRPGEWQNITLSFSISAPMTIEFRGIYVTNMTTVSLDYILIEQISVPKLEKCGITQGAKTLSIWSHFEYTFDISNNSARDLELDLIRLGYPSRQIFKAIRMSSSRDFANHPFSPCMTTSLGPCLLYVKTGVPQDKLSNGIYPKGS